MITNKNLVFNSTKTSKNQVFEEIGIKVASQKLSSKTAVVDALKKREKQISTGVGEEFAIPHGKVKGLKKPVVVIVKFRKNGINWDSIDGKNVKLVIAILVPEGDKNEHFEILTKLSAKLANTIFANKVKKLPKAEIVKLINNIKKIPAKKAISPKFGKINIVGVTSCPTGIAHTYMAAEKLNEAAKKLGFTSKIETQGQTVENRLTQEEIDQADIIILAIDREIEMSRFEGKEVIKTNTRKAIHTPDDLILGGQDGTHRLLTKVKAIGKKAEKGEVAEGELNFENFWRRIYKAVMNGVSHMLPFVVFGGIFIALSFLIDINNAGNDSYGKGNIVAEWFNGIGVLSMGLMVPILSAYLAYGMIGRQGLLPGFLVGMIAAGAGPSWLEILNVKPPEWVPEGAAGQIAASGFIGGIFGSIMAVAIVIPISQLFDKLPKSLRGIKQILLLPLVGTAAVVSIFWFVNIPLTYLFWGLFAGLEEISNRKLLWLLGILLGGMMAVDMGGPINKTAYTFGVVLVGTSINGSVEMAAVMAGGMVPPLAIGMATLTKRKKIWDKQDIEAGYTNWIMGASFITEGAIPFAAKYPKAVMPSIITGSAVAGGLTAAFKIALNAPHGGIFTMALVNTDLVNAGIGGVSMGAAIGLYFASILIGSLIAATMIVFLRLRQVKTSLVVGQ